MVGKLHRCYHCKTIVLPGMFCTECGSRRTYIAWKITNEEMARAVEAGYEPDLKTFIHMSDAEAEFEKHEKRYPGLTIDA